MLGPQRRGGRWRRGGRAAITRAPLALASPARLPCPPLPRPQAEAMLGQLKLAPDACAQQLVRAAVAGDDFAGERASVRISSRRCAGGQQNEEAGGEEANGAMHGGLMVV